MLNTIRYLVTLAAYLLVGCLVHRWIFGAIQWDDTGSWGVIALWPFVMGAIITGIVMLICVMVGVTVILYLLYARFRGWLDIARLRAKTRREMKQNKDTHAKP